MKNCAGRIKTIRSSENKPLEPSADERLKSNCCVTHSYTNGNTMCFTELEEQHAYTLKIDNIQSLNESRKDNPVSQLYN